MEILLEALIPKIQWKEPSIPDGFKLYTYDNPISNVKDKYNETRPYMTRYYNESFQKSQYNILIPQENPSILPSEDVNNVKILNKNKMTILRNHGVYTLRLEFYGMKPKYHGICWQDKSYTYSGSFKEDEEETSKPYLKEYPSLSLEDLFLLLNKIVKAFQINENVLIQDFANNYFRAINGSEMVNAIVNYILIKAEYGKGTINNNNAMF